MLGTLEQVFSPLRNTNFSIPIPEEITFFYESVSIFQSTDSSNFGELVYDLYHVSRAHEDVIFTAEGGEWKWRHHVRLRVCKATDIAKWMKSTRVRPWWWKHSLWRPRMVKQLFFIFSSSSSSFPHHCGEAEVVHETLPSCCYHYLSVKLRLWWDESPTYLASTSSTTFLM